MEISRIIYSLWIEKMTLKNVKCLPNKTGNTWFILGC